MFIFPFWVVAAVFVFGAEAWMWGWITNPGSFAKDSGPLQVFAILVLLAFFPVTAVVAVAASVAGTQSKQ